MDDYFDLGRRFALMADYTPEEIFASAMKSRQHGWDQVLEGRFSVVVGRANFGKTTEFRAKSRMLRSEGKPAIFVRLHLLLATPVLDEALDPDDRDQLAGWKKHGGELIVMVDSLDEASLGKEDGISWSMKRLCTALDWPRSPIRWVLSSRPAVLSDHVLRVLEAELRTKRFDPRAEREKESEATETGGAKGRRDAGAEAEPKPDPLKLYALLSLDSEGAATYLARRHGIANPRGPLVAAGRFGLGRLAEGPGGLDIIAYVDLVGNPPSSLTSVLEKVAGAVQQQERVDPRERRIDRGEPENLDEAIGRLACASLLCQLPNIELSHQALKLRPGVLAARPLIAPVLSEASMEYLLGSRLFIDAGHEQVKLYPDELLPFLAAKRLAAMVKSPGHARRLMDAFTWRASTGEQGVFKHWLPLAGWLSVFSMHCRKLLLDIEPEAVAFFGDLRNPAIPAQAAEDAIEGALRRVVEFGDTPGRGHFHLTAENYWQAAKPGLEPALLRLMNAYGGDRRARELLLEVAAEGRLDIFRAAVRTDLGGNWRGLPARTHELHYILDLGRSDDRNELAAVVLEDDGLLGEGSITSIVSQLAWNTLTATQIAQVTANLLRRPAQGVSIGLAITRRVAPEASDGDLYRLTRAFLLQLLKLKKRKSGRDSETFYAGQRFAELVSSLLAASIRRRAIRPLRASAMCLVLNRHLVTFSFERSDMEQLHAALKADRQARMGLLQGLLRPTDGTPNAVFDAVYVHGTMYPYVNGDEALAKHSGFTKVVVARKKRAAQAPANPAKAGSRMEIDARSKKALGKRLEGIRGGTDVQALEVLAVLLSRTTDTLRYSEADYAVVRNELGAEITEALRQGLTTVWRATEPTWQESDRLSIDNHTVAGLQGLHVDLGDGSSLPAMTAAEVGRAFRYGVFEVNGYPVWFWKLAAAHPETAREVFQGIFSKGADGEVSQDHAETLVRHLDGGPLALRLALVTAMWEFLATNATISRHTCDAGMSLLLQNDVKVDQGRFEAIALRRVQFAFMRPPEIVTPPKPRAPASPNVGRRILRAARPDSNPRRDAAMSWAWASMHMFPDRFVEVVEACRSKHPVQTNNFLLHLAAFIGEDHGARLARSGPMHGAYLRMLRQLYDWVVAVVRPEADVIHAPRVSYYADVRDNAESLRDALVLAIAEAKSEEAYQILGELLEGSIGEGQRYLRSVRFRMREAQADWRPLPQASFAEFERTFAPPLSSYMEFAAAVETDLLVVKEETETGEFSLRRFFSTLSYDRVTTDQDALALEEDFQSLLGRELYHASAGRYAVSLEAVLPDSTRRDVLCSKDEMHATVELKMSARWTIAQYLTALEHQLLGQYMQGTSSKVGFFVVVLQKKDRRWQGPEGKPVDFEGVLAILRDKARELERRDEDLYLRVIGIDASGSESFRINEAKPAGTTKNPARRRAGAAVPSKRSRKGSSEA